MSALKLGLIGVGTHGARYANHIRNDVPDAELVAVCRRNRAEGETIARTLGCAYHEDWHALVAHPGLDAVVVVVPPPLHGEIVDAAARARKHVLLEKPMAINLEEARRIRQAVRANGVRCMLAHTLRFSGVIQALKEAVPSIAPVHSLYLSQRFEPSPLRWLDSQRDGGGGLVLHCGVHNFDLVRYLTGVDIDSVSCQLARVTTRETEDAFTATFSAGGGRIMGTVADARTGRGRTGYVEVAGAGGALLADHLYGTLHLVQGRQRTALPVASNAPTVPDVARTFAQCLRDGSEFPVGMDDGARAVAVADACYRSAKERRPAEVERL